MDENNLNENLVGQLRALNDLAGERGQTLAQMALSWVLREDAVTSVLIGASSPAQILDNIGIVKDAGFTGDELDRIDEILGRK